MSKLMKYLKPFTGVILISVLLLFVQAMTDLALPDYLSDIVNKGIQQGGIENAVPEAIRESQMNRVALFMDENQKEEVLKNYTLVNSSSTEYKDYVEKYPTLEKEPIYVLNAMEEEKFEKLNIIMGKGFLAVAGVNKVKEEAKGGEVSFGNQKIPANVDLFSIIEKLPIEQRLQMSNEVEKRFSALGDSMIIQAATSLVKEEYADLGMNTDQIQNKFIINRGILMLLMSLLGAICTVLVGFLSARVAAGLSQNLRKNIFAKVESFSNTEFDKFSTASLITRTTNDITQIQMLVIIMIRMVFYAPIMGVGGILRAVGKSSSMSWIIAVAVAALLSLILIVLIVAMPRFKLIQKLIDRLNLVTRENLLGMMVIRAFNTQKFEEERFNKANKELTDTNLFVNRVMAFMMPAMMFLLNGISLLVVWVGAHQVENASMQVGDMIAFMQYVIQIIFAFVMLSMMFIMIPRASVSAQRVAEVLEVNPVIVDPKEPKTFRKKLNGTIEFKNVSFRYPGAEEDVLKNISFKASPGKTTAFIGSTGSGKTTLINLIPRFYDVTEGQILVDGLDIREVSQHELRNHIGYVPQKGSLFKGTIESNLKYANENATTQEISKASEIAQAMEFIKEKPEKFGTEISQGGTNVSGGQKQRLSIARALVKEPQIYIFDDSFSALDFKTDAALRKALKEQTAESTVLIVAQRISTIMNAEQIIVLEEGRIVGIGTHKELMKNCDTYQEIASSQLSKEELA